MSILASLSALVCAGGAIVVYDMYTFRESMQQRLETDGDIIGANSASALLFDDVAGAMTNLKALEAEQHVQAAAIYRPDGEMYASWSRDPTSLVPRRLDARAGNDSANRVIATRAIFSGAERIGTIMIEADLGERTERFRRHLGIVVLVALGSLLLAIPISAHLQRSISGPILALAETARVVSRDEDYSVRATADAQDETGELVATFNSMLDRIEQRDAELREARDNLERRVETRTVALQRQLEETQRAQNALKESELLLAEAQGLAEVGSWKWDVAADRLQWSAELRKIYGVDPAECETIYGDFLRYVHPDDRASVEDAIARAGRKGSSFSFDYRIVRPDGEVRMLHASGNVILDEQGNPTRMVGTGHDITDRRRVEEERATRIRAQAERAEAEAAEARAALLAQISSELSSSFAVEPSLARVVRLAVPQFADACSVRLVEGEHIPLIALADTDPRQEAVALDLEARYPARVTDSTFTALAVMKGRPQIVSPVGGEYLARIARDEEHLQILRRLAFRSAIVVPLVVREATFGVITFSSRSEGRYDNRSELSLAENIGSRVAVAIENRRLYREAQEANRIKDEFLATLSHELRSPLNAIVGWAELLQSGKLDTETAKRAIETIERNARAQARLIEDILDVSRIVAGKLQIEMQPVDLETVVNTAVHSVHPAALAKGVRLEYTNHVSSAPVAGDAARLHQIVWNLLSNAIKFTPQGGRVDVRVSRSGSHAEVIVQDTGVGIEPKFLAHVFDRFRQADSTSTRSHKGLGLGLAIVRHLVELHGGRVEASSEGEGRGATFRMTLPIRVSSQVANVLPLALDPAQGELLGDTNRLAGLSVLVVDDEADTRELLAMVLGRVGARVVCVDSADEAFTVVQRNSIDLLISDIEMPGCDGFELIRRIRSLPPETGGGIPAAALTAYARNEDRVKAIVAGFNIHLAKPIQPAELVAVAASLMRRS